MSDRRIKVDGNPETNNINFDAVTVVQPHPVMAQNFPPVPPSVPWDGTFGGGGGSGINFPLAANLGGTGFASYAIGDILYANSVSSLARLAATTNGFVLTLAGGLPAWASVGAIGVVTSVSGTANRITSSGGVTPIIDIAAGYVGQASITTLGTITTGIWNGTNIDASKIADGTVSSAEFQFINSLTSNAQTQLNAKQPLDSTLTALAAYNTNGILTQTATDTFVGRTITGTASRLSVTNGDGVAGNPTLNIDTGYVGQSSITTLGTIATGAWNGTAIGPTVGGTGLTSYAAGSILYASASNVLSALAASTNGFILTLVGGFPAWATPAATISGSGTIGTIPKFSTSTALADSIIIEAAGVGIGIGVTPTARFQVKGTGTTTGVGFLFEDSAGTDRVTILDNGKVKIFNSADNLDQLLVSGSALGTRIGSGQIEGVDPTGLASYQPLKVGGSQLIFTISNSEKARLDASGNLSLGSATARGKFDLQGIDTEAWIGNAVSNAQVAVLGNSRRQNYGDFLFGKNLAGVAGTDTYRTVATSTGFGYSGMELRYLGDIHFYAKDGNTTAGAVVAPDPRLVIIGATGHIGFGQVPSYRCDVIDNTASGRAGNFRQSSSTGYGVVVIPGADSTYDALRIRNAADSLTMHSFFGSGDATLCQGGGGLMVGSASVAATGRLLELNSSTNPVMRLSGGVGSYLLQEFLQNGTTVGAIGYSGSSMQIAYGSNFDTNFIGVNSSGNVGINGMSFADGVKVLFVANATTVPTTNPTGGALFFTDGGIPKFRTSGGNVVVLSKSSAYTPTNVSTDRSFDANATTLDELADVVGTMIADLKSNGFLG